MTLMLARWAEFLWYKNAYLGMLLLPLACIFSCCVRFRRFLYRKGLLKSYSLPVPVIVVGNITVGGTGKTPLTLWLAQMLKQSGYKPGIISRGYGGKSIDWPQAVTETSDVKQVGDEAMLMALRKLCPVVVGSSRVASAQKLLSEFGCDVVLSDDGLQHYALNRDIEIAVIDGERRFGNGYCLPAGPLREPVDRLRSVDIVVVNGNKKGLSAFTMQFMGDAAVNLKTGEQKTLQQFQNSTCHALAGIGNPDRFFTLLSAKGLTLMPHRFPDHYAFERNDIDFNDDKTVLMTEKDAVKCKQFASQQHWYVPIKAVPEPAFKQQFLDLLHKKHD